MSPQTSSSAKQTPAEMADAIVRAALSHVPFDGWSHTSLIMGAQDCGLDEAALAEALPKGVDDAIAVYAAIADKDMVAQFHEMADKPEKTHLKIRALILCRLRLAMAHKETVSKTMAYLAQPTQAAMASKLLYQSVDAMWRAAGDEATDMSFYTKRATLAAVYSATLLAFIADDSGDMAKTEAFLDRRLKDVAMIPKLTKPAKAVMSGAASIAAQLASTIRAGRNAR